MFAIPTTNLNSASAPTDPRLSQVLDFTQQLHNLVDQGEGDRETFLSTRCNDLIATMRTLNALATEVQGGSGDSMVPFLTLSAGSREAFVTAAKRVQRNMTEAGVNFGAFLANSTEALGSIVNTLKQIAGPASVREHPALAMERSASRCEDYPDSDMESLSRPEGRFETSRKDERDRSQAILDLALGIAERLGIPQQVAQYFIAQGRAGYDPHQVIHHNQAADLGLACRQLRDSGLSEKNCLALLTGLSDLVAKNESPNENAVALWALGPNVGSYLLSIRFPLHDQSGSEQPSLTPRVLAGIKGHLLTISSELS